MGVAYTEVCQKGRDMGRKVLQRSDNFEELERSVTHSMSLGKMHNMLHTQLRGHHSTRFRLAEATDLEKKPVTRLPQGLNWKLEAL